MNLQTEDNKNISELNQKTPSSDNLYSKKKKLIEISKNLSQLEYLEIFNIIEEDNCQYSENKNGIFINLNNVNEITIDKIFNFINFIKHKKEDLIKQEEVINNAKKNITDINKNNEKNINTNTNINININNDLYDTKESYDDYDISENESVINSNNYLIFSSDEDDDIENKISLKKKKTKYSGKKAKMIKSIKDGNDINKLKNRSKKSEE
jgi:hypothetical protein